MNSRVQGRRGQHNREKGVGKHEEQHVCTYILLYIGMPMSMPARSHLVVFSQTLHAQLLNLFSDGCTLRAKALSGLTSFGKLLS